MKFNDHIGASALEGSTTLPPVRTGVPNSPILPVLLRILIQFAIVCLSLQMMIDSYEDQNISAHAKPHDMALRRASGMSSGTTAAQQRFLHDSIDFRDARNCLHARDDPFTKRGGEGSVYPPADVDSRLAAQNARASRSYTSAPAP